MLVVFPPSELIRSAAKCGSRQQPSMGGKVRAYTSSVVCSYLLSSLFYMSHFTVLMSSKLKNLAILAAGISGMAVFVGWSILLVQTEIFHQLSEDFHYIQSSQIMSPNDTNKPLVSSATIRCCILLHLCPSQDELSSLWWFLTLILLSHHHVKISICPELHNHLIYQILVY